MLRCSKKHARKNWFLYLLLFCILLLLIYSTSNHYRMTLVQEDARSDSHITSETDLDKNITLKEFFSVVPISSTNVFLIWPLQNPVLLYRCLCATESWAVNHPNASIWYMFTVSEIEDPGGLSKKLLKEYPNIRFIYCDVDQLMKDTPLYNLTKTKAWESSKWPATQMADFLRQAALWHKGGYYSDTDVYPVRSLNQKRNFISTSLGTYDVKLLHNDYHHPWNKAVMETIANTYNPRKYWSAGPDAGKATAIRECGEEYGKNVGKQERNCSMNGQIITFLHENYAPITCAKSFKPNNIPLYENYLAVGAHAFHLCNSATRRIPAAFGSKSILDNLANRNCPLIYNQVQRYTNFW